jgi:hypothetical protein
MIQKFQIETLSEVAFQLGVDDLSEASLDLALSDLRLKVAKLPADNFRRTQKLEANKEEKLEAIKLLSRSENTLRKAEAEAHSHEAEMNQVHLENCSFIVFRKIDFEMTF